MNSEVFFNDNFSENGEKPEAKENLMSRVNFSWIRALACFLVLTGLLFCRHFFASYYTKIGEFYSVNFKNDDEKIAEIKNLVLDKIGILRLTIKEEINNL